MGHGTLSTQSLGDLLTAAGVTGVVDVRRFPASRRQPHLARDVLGPALAEHGLSYRWDERLGGRRSLPRDQPVVDVWWTVLAFRAYAAHTRTDAFLAGLGELLGDVERGPVAVLCSEAVWWRCHRRLVADVVLAHGVAVRHLMPDGRLVDHRLSPGARLRSDGCLVWDAAPEA